MSLLLGQRKTTDRLAGHRAERPPGDSLVAGVPVLLRLPDLSSGRPKRGLKTSQGAPEDGSPLKDSSGAQGGAPSQAASSPPTENKVKRLGRSFLGNALWQVLVLGGCAVLFIVSWIVISWPKSEESHDDAEEISAPDIEIGQPVSPDALVAPSLEMPAEPATPDSGQPGEGSPDTTAMRALPHSETMTTGNQMADLPGTSKQGWRPADAASPSNGGPAQTWNPPGASPVAGAAGAGSGAAPNGGAFPTGGPIQPDAGATASQGYPSTGTSGYRYPSTGNAAPPADEPAARVGRRLEASPYPYPSTGAPPFYRGIGGTAPGVQSR